MYMYSVFIVHACIASYPDLPAAHKHNASSRFSVAKELIHVIMFADGGKVWVRGYACIHAGTYVHGLQ